MTYDAPAPDPMSAPMPALVPTYNYAHWFSRVGAYFVDALVTFLALIPSGIGVAIFSFWTNAEMHEDASGNLVIDDIYWTTSSYIAVAVTALGVLFYFGFIIWNLFIRQGRTGQTIGKSALGIKLVKEATGAPAGGWLCFGRQILHFIDGLICYLGYLWPLWDSKRQTFADKIVSTVVVKV